MSSESHKKLGAWVAEKLAAKDERIANGEDAAAVLNDYSLAFNVAKQVLELTDTEADDLESIHIALETIEDDFDDLEREKARAERKAKLAKIAGSK